MLSLMSRLEEKTHIIWDWNGTLIDDIELCAAVTAELMREHGLTELGRDRHRQLMRMPVRAFYLDAGFDLEKVSFEYLAREFGKRYRERVESLALYPGAKDLLALAKNGGKRQAILSAANQVDLDHMVKHYDIADYFDHVFGLGDHFAVSKIERGHELLERWKASPGDVILVGDMEHDIEVAKELGIEALILADGHQCYSRLQGLHHNMLESRYR